MHLSYGPPGLKGVTQMMAVGDSEPAAPAPEAQVVKQVAVASAAAAVLATLLGARRLRSLAVGATLGTGLTYLLVRGPGA